MDFAINAMWTAIEVAIRCSVRINLFVRADAFALSCGHGLHGQLQCARMPLAADSDATEHA